MTSKPRLPFGFARKHGVAVLGLANGKARIACRPDVKPEALLELRRFLGTPLAPEKVPAERFEALLQELYEGGGEDSRSMAADIDQKLDLKQLADRMTDRPALERHGVLSLVGVWLECSAEALDDRTTLPGLLARLHQWQSAVRRGDEVAATFAERSDRRGKGCSAHGEHRAHHSHQ